MPVTVTPNTAPDIAVTTLNKMKKGKFTHAAKTLRDLTLVRSLVGGGGRRMVGVNLGDNAVESKTISGGIEWEFRIMLDANAQYSNVGLYADDTINVTDTMDKGYEPLRSTTTNYGYDLQEPFINSGEERIINVLDGRRCAVMTVLLEGVERMAWGKPEDSTDVLTPLGIGMYVVKATSGDYGANPTGFTSVAGLSHNNWRNLAGQYKVVDWDDLIYQMERMYIRLKWMNFPKLPASAEQKELNCGIFVNEETYLKLLGLARSQTTSNNVRTSAELSAHMDKITFNGVPVQIASALNEHSDNPVYFLNLNCLKFGVRKGWFFKETPPMEVKGKHNARAIFLDLNWSVLCDDRRTSGVLVKT